MRLVDSHCHLDDEQFDADREQVIERALAAGVECMMTIDAPEIADRYSFLYSTVGVHPHEASNADLARIRAFAAHPKVLAVGEIGLDYHYDFAPRRSRSTPWILLEPGGGYFLARSLSKFFNSLMNSCTSLKSMYTDANRT